MLMRTAVAWLTPVKASGLAAYLMASAASAATSIRSDDRRITRLAAILCALDLFLTLDIAFNWRWKLHDQLSSSAMTHNWYDQRSGPQILALAFLAVVLLVAAVAFGRRLSSIRGGRMILCGALISIGCWWTEVISLHAIDAILYRSVGPFMVVCFVWMFAAITTTAGILRAK
jgi:hypothetical protein